MAGLRDYTEFDAWKLADKVRTEVERLTASSAFRREPNLRQQLQEAADGPPGHIAEGFSRFSPKDFARFVRIAKGSLSETIDHLGVARRRRLIGDVDGAKVISLARRARGACTGLVIYLESAKAPDPPPPMPKPKRRTENEATADSGTLNPEPQNPEPENSDEP